MCDDLGVSLAREFSALLFQLLAQFTEILDDAVVDYCDVIGRVRMRVVLGRCAMRGPSGVADARGPDERRAIVDVGTLTTESVCTPCDFA